MWSVGLMVQSLHKPVIIYKFATLKWFTHVPGLGPELCHDRGLALPHPWDCVGVTGALAVSF